MCFSAEASFAAGAVLVPTGLYCLKSALSKRPGEWPWAMVPLLFGLQQISEGFVWQGLHCECGCLPRSAALVYLFFALALWPFWFCLIAAVSEPIPRKRRVFQTVALLATLWFWVLWYPLLTGPEELLSMQVVGHSIQYQYPGLAIYEYVPKNILQMLYLASVAVPIAFSTQQASRVPGGMLLISAVVSRVVYEHAFISVWCFFAAWISIWLAWHFYSVKSEESEGSSRTNEIAAPRYAAFSARPPAPLRQHVLPDRVPPRTMQDR